MTRTIDAIGELHDFEEELEGSSLEGFTEEFAKRRRSELPVILEKKQYQLAFVEAAEMGEYFKSYGFDGRFVYLDDHVPSVSGKYENIREEIERKAQAINHSSTSEKERLKEMIGLVFEATDESTTELREEHWARVIDEKYRDDAVVYVGKEHLREDGLPARLEERGMEINIVYMDD